VDAGALRAAGTQMAGAWINRSAMHYPFGLDLEIPGAQRISGQMRATQIMIRVKLSSVFEAAVAIVVREKDRRHV